jgi:hypothetical protein
VYLAVTAIASIATDMVAVPAISVSSAHVSGSRTGAGSDDNSPGSAVVAFLRRGAETCKRSEYENYPKKHG